MVFRRQNLITDTEGHYRFSGVIVGSLESETVSSLSHHAAACGGQQVGIVCLFPREVMRETRAGGLLVGVVYTEGSCEPSHVWHDHQGLRAVLRWKSPLQRSAL